MVVFMQCVSREAGETGLGASRISWKVTKLPNWDIIPKPDFSWILNRVRPHAGDRRLGVMTGVQSRIGWAVVGSHRLELSRRTILKPNPAIHRCLEPWLIQFPSGADMSISDDQGDHCQKLDISAIYLERLIQPSHLRWVDMRQRFFCAS